MDAFYLAIVVVALAVFALLLLRQAFIAGTLAATAFSASALVLALNGEAALAVVCGALALLGVWIVADDYRYVTREPEDGAE